MKDNLLVGRRAVHTQVEREWDGKNCVEKSRKTFRGVIAALVVTGQDNYPAVVMLYDDGALRTHAISTITIEADAQEGPYR